MKRSTKIKNYINKVLSLANLYLQKRNPGVDPTEQLVTSLNHFNINYVIDIGANVGQFSVEILDNGFKGEIISFEPLTSAYSELVKNSKKYNNWTIYPKSAIGNTDGEIEINISNNSVSSSILNISKKHIDASNESRYIGIEKVRIHKLDSLFSKEQLKDKNIFIKIDTQGFEWQVLEGASNILEDTKGLLCELSFDKLYEGQHLWQEIITKLEQYNFKLWSLQYGLTDKTTGQTLQCDAIFYKN